MKNLLDKAAIIRLKQEGISNRGVARTLGIDKKTVNKYSFVQIENNFYSVPEYLVGLTVTSKIYYNKILIYSNNEFVYEHKKLDGVKKISANIRYYLKTLTFKPGALRKSYVLKNYEDEIKEAKQTKKDYEIFLDELLEKEIAQRKENGIKKRLRYAKFPIKKYIEDFDRKLYNPEFIKEFDELETLEFIDKKENIILVRNTWCKKNTLNSSMKKVLLSRKKTF